MRKVPAIGAIINADKAEALKGDSRRHLRAPLDVFNDDQDAYFASWEDFYQGGTGRWYDTKRRDILDLDRRLDAEPNHDDKMREAHDDALNDMREENDGTDH